MAETPQDIEPSSDKDATREKTTAGGYFACGQNSCHELTAEQIAKIITETDRVLALRKKQD